MGNKMAASEQCKKAILVFFQQKGGGVLPEAFQVQNLI